MWGSFQDLLEQQYVLAKKCNMPVSETNAMADFEREIYVNILIRDMEEEKKAIEKK